MSTAFFIFSKDVCDLGERFYIRITVRKPVRLGTVDRRNSWRRHIRGTTMKATDQQVCIYLNFGHKLYEVYNPEPKYLTSEQEPIN